MATLKYKQPKSEETRSQSDGEKEQPELSLHTFDVVTSTNQKLWELLEGGAKPLTVAIADRQTAGRGQWGRQWQSEAGGLYLSIALAPQIPAKNGSQLTLCTAWGIATALRNYQIPVLLKWPNDLILWERKLGGIKIETRTQQGKITQAVVGVGINWRNSVPDTAINLQSFFQTQQTPTIVSLEKLIDVTLEGLLHGYQRYLSEGIEALLPSYLELLSMRGKSVVVDGYSGVVVGITASGELHITQSAGAATGIW